MEVALVGDGRSNSLACLVASLYSHGSLPEAGILTTFKCLICACTIFTGLVLSLKGEGGSRGREHAHLLVWQLKAQRGHSRGTAGWRAFGIRRRGALARVPQLLPLSLALSQRA